MTGFSQIEESSALFKELKTKDSLLFEIGFNKCQLDLMSKLFSEDLEFYHDKGGVTNSKTAFLSVMKDGICNESSENISRRELVKGTLKVFPLYNNGNLYGALQTGEHRFFESIKGQPEKSGSVAKFSHLWLKENNDWVLKCVISYDHKMQSYQTHSTIELSQNIMDRYVGNYKTEKDTSIKISKIESGLEITAREFQSPIYPTSENVFYHKQAHLTFEFIEEENILKLIIKENNIIVDKAIKE